MFFIVIYSIYIAGGGVEQPKYHMIYYNYDTPGMYPGVCFKIKNLVNVS